MLARPLALALVATIAIAATAAPVYRCTSPSGSVELRDTPCNTSDSETRKNIGAPTTQEQISAALKDTQAEADACKSKYTHRCVDLEKQRASLTKSAATLRTLGDKVTTTALAADAAVTTARLDYRIANEDYERLDAEIRTSYGRDNFHQLLNERSAAATRRMNADSLHYRLTGKWLSR